MRHGVLRRLVDLIGQRLTEIWQSLPFLYVVIIAMAVVPNDVFSGTKVVLLCSSW